MQVQTSDVNQTLEQADAQTHQGDDDEHQQERSAYDGRTNGSGPGHGGGENITNVTNQGGNGHSSLSRSNASFQ